MALKKVNDLGKNEYELEITVDADVFAEACTAAFRKNAPKISVPGFRKGKAPRHMIEKMYGRGVFYDDALNAVVPDAFEQALKEAKLEPVSRPDYDVETADDTGVSFKVKFFNYPKVEVSDYLGIKADRTVEAVTDEQVDSDIANVRERNGRTIEVTRKAKKGDTATIDYDGSVDGVHFDGGAAQDHPLKLGSGSFIPGFEDQVIGHKAGDEFDVNVTFPEDYHEETLKGKAAVFAVKVKKLEELQLPELDDEFAKDVSDFDTFAEYKADVRAKLEEKAAKDADAKVEEQLVSTLVDTMKVDVPDAMIEAEAENMVRDYDSRLRMQGLDLNTYMKYTGQTLEAMREQFKPQAERQVKMRLALEKIVELEKIEATDADIEEEYKKMSEAYGMEIADIKKYVTDESLKKDIAVRHAVELIKAKASITDKKPGAKKTAAKKTDAGEKKAPAKKTAEKKPAEKKPAAKKPAAKKPASKKEDK